MKRERATKDPFQKFQNYVQVTAFNNRNFRT